MCECVYVYARAPQLYIKRLIVIYTYDIYICKLHARALFARYVYLSVMYVARTVLMKSLLNLFQKDL